LWRGRGADRHVMPSGPLPLFPMLPMGVVVWPSICLMCSASAPCPERELHVDGLGRVVLSGGEILSGSTQVKLRHSDFASLLMACPAPEADPSQIARLPLLGGSISFYVDLSNVGCACNLAVYLVASPARDPQGRPDAGRRGDYYCDASRVGGQWCPEIDLMEANRHAFQATPHSCEAPTGDHHYTSCDRDGCAQNARALPGAYGHGSEHKIDTRFPFEVRTHFDDGGDELVGMRTVLSQQGRSIEFRSCASGYLSALSRQVREGMNLVLSYWGDEPARMDWLDSQSCGRQACHATAGVALITGLRVSLGAPPPTTPMTTAPPLPPLLPPLPAPQALSPQAPSHLLCADDGSQWTEERSRKCCQLLGVGCVGSTPASTLAPTPALPSPSPRLSCVGDASQWTADESRECCEKRGVGCTATTTARARIQCSGGSVEESWCCAHGVDALQQSNLRDAQWAMCCRVAQVECAMEARAPAAWEAAPDLPPVPSRPHFDCGNSWGDAMWTAEKRAHCCAAEGLGCLDSAPRASDRFGVFRQPEDVAAPGPGIGAAACALALGALACASPFVYQELGRDSQRAVHASRMSDAAGMLSQDGPGRP